MTRAERKARLREIARRRCQWTPDPVRSCTCAHPDPDRCAGLGVTPPPREAWEGPDEAPCDCGCHR